MKRQRVFGFSLLPIAVLILAIWLTGCRQQPKNESKPDPTTTSETAVVPEAPTNQDAAKAVQNPDNDKAVDTAQNEAVPNDSVNPGAVEVVPVPENDAPGNEVIPENAANQAVPQNDEPVVQNRIDSLDPLTDVQKQKLSAIEWDVDPEILNAVEQKNEGGHFPFSDEKHLDLFKESIENLGGSYVGVGTDQSYLFVGWQRPTLAFMIDYDPWVIVIHRMYMAFWQACEDSACLHHYFDDRDTGLAFLESEAGAAAELNTKAVNKIYRTTQRSIARQLKRLERMPVKTFMNDPESFQYIKQLIQMQRLRTFQANLLGDRAFASLSATLKELGAQVTTLYLSNAEQYWGYSAQFKKNMIEIPASDNALILRTSATYPVNNDYRYSIQPIKVFKAWLAHPEGKTVRQVTKRVRVKDAEDFPFVVDDFMPPET